MSFEIRPASSASSVLLVVLVVVEGVLVAAPSPSSSRCARVAVKPPLSSLGSQPNADQPASPPHKLVVGGRQEYHGKNELVPTDQMDIIDAMTVDGRFDLKHWTEMKDIDPDDAFGKEVYYWRQTLDFTNQSLSERLGADGA
jgi:hypothetical protein